MWPIFKLVNLFYLLVSGYVWFGFLLPGHIIPIIVSLLMIVCFALGNFNVKFTPRVYALLGLLVLYFLWGTFILGIPHGVLMLMSYLPAVLLFMLDIDHQRDLLRYVTKWVCILLIISLIGFMISFVVPLPHSYFLPAGMENIYSVFENYIIFIKRTGYAFQNMNIVRFCGPFIEPGHLSMVCCLLLFANGYRMKEYPLMWILVISVLVSLSLAGYVILLAGLCFIKIRNIYTLLTIVGLGFATWFSVAVLWNDGQNPVNVMIFQRLEYDEEKGIAGNNRTVIQTDYFYSKSVNDGSIWLGVRTQKRDNVKIVGAGYKIYFLRYGWISAIFVGLFYILLINPKSNRRYALSFFTLIVFLFLQRAYPWGYSWLFPYVLGIGLTRGMDFFHVSMGDGLCGENTDECHHSRTELVSDISSNNAWDKADSNEIF